jgi:uroporphyrinogen III methyltransferase / synthase
MKVVVTRAEEQADDLVARLEALGHDVVRCPLIRVEPLADEPIDPAPYDWVVVTSPNGAHELARRLVSPPAQLAAIGPGTADALHEHGLRVDLVPRVHTQEGLRDELPRGRVLLAAAEGARRDVLEADFLPLYRTIELRPPRRTATSRSSRRRLPRGRSQQPAHAFPWSPSGRRPRPRPVSTASRSPRSREATTSTVSSRP